MYIFKFLGKINYGAFLTHTFVLWEIAFESDETMLKYEIYEDILMFVFPKVLIMTVVVSTVLFVCIEMPVISTCRLLLNGYSSRKLTRNKIN